MVVLAEGRSRGEDAGWTVFQPPDRSRRPVSSHSRVVNEWEEPPLVQVGVTDEHQWRQHRRGAHPDGLQTGSEDPCLLGTHPVTKDPINHVDVGEAPPQGGKSSVREARVPHLPDKGAPGGIRVHRDGKPRLPVLTSHPPLEVNLAASFIVPRPIDVVRGEVGVTVAHASG